MKDMNRSKEDLINELQQLRKHNLELEFCLKEKKCTNASCIDIVQDIKKIEFILEAIPSSIIVVDNKHRTFSYMNERAKSLYGFDYTGYSLEEQAEQIKALKPEGSPFPLEDMPAIHALNDGRVVRNIEMIIETGQGEQVPVLVSSAPVYNSVGVISHAIVIFEEITAFKKVEKQWEKLLDKCEKQESLLQCIIESLPVGLWITDANGKMIEINDHAREIWGGAVPYANSVCEYGAYKARWAETGKGVLAEEMPMAQALKGETIKEVALDFDRFDGTKGTQLVSTAPIRDAKGGILGCVGIAQDITKQKMFEQALSQSENRFRSFVTAISDVVYHMNSDWSEMRQLHGKNFVADTDKPNAKWIDVYIFPEDQERVLKVIEEAIRTKSILQLDHPVRMLNGKMAWVHSKAIPILDHNGEIVEWFGNSRDITMQKKAMDLHVANRTLEESIQMKDEFLSLVSHEFRTPIAVISVAVQALNSIYRHEITPNVKKYIGTIKQNNLRQLRLVNNLLDISRAHSDQAKINKGNIDIVLLTKCITESVYEYALQKDIELTFESSLQTNIIAMDDEKYERILLNLLSNAIKFTPKGERIGVKVYRYKGNVCIQVKDSGIGIPADKIDIIFKRFGQVNSVLSRQAEGTGIGLSLVSKLIQVLGGKIIVKSKVGKGSIFTVVFPNKTIVEEDHEVASIDLKNSQLIDTINVEFADIYL